MSGAHRRHQRVEIDDVGAAEEDERGASAHRRELVGPDEALVLGGDRGNGEDRVALGHNLFQRRGDDAMGAQDRSGKPGVEHPDGHAEPRQQSVQRPAEIAKADQANFGSADQAGALVAVAAPGFAALAERARGRADAAGEIERHGEAEFGDRLGKDGAGRHHVDAAIKQVSDRACCR